MQPSKEIHDLVVATVERYMNDARRLYPAFADSASPRIEYFRRRRSAGAASWSTWRLSFNIDFLERNLDDMIGNTIPHEVAHLVVGRLWPHVRRHHGREWQAVMLRFGVAPSRTHAYCTEGLGIRRQQRHEYRCNCKVHHITTVRHNQIRFRGKRYRCLDCKAVIVWAGDVREAAREAE